MSRQNWEIYFDTVKKQEWAKARDVLNEIAKTEKTNPQVYLKMGDVCQRAGDTANAIKAYHVSARIQSLQGFNQKALALYKIILRLDAKNHEAISRTQELIKEMEGPKMPPMPARVALPPQVHIPEPTPEDVKEVAAPPVESPGFRPQPEYGAAPEVLPTGFPEDEPEPEPGIPKSDQSWMERTALTPEKKGEPEYESESEPGAVPTPEHSWMQRTTLNSGETGQPAEEGSNWIESTSYASEAAEEKTSPAEEQEMFAPPSSGTWRGDLPGEDQAVSDETVIPSMEDIFADLPEDGFQKMLDDLIIPLSERNAPDKAVPELFAGLSGDDFGSILSELGTKFYPDSAPVIEEGDTGDSMYIIKSGTARVIAHMLGKEIELARLSEGALFGEVAFLTGRPRTASVIAAGPLEVYEISRFDIERMIDRNPEIMSRIEGFHETRVKDTIKKIMPKQ